MTDTDLHSRSDSADSGRRPMARDQAQSVTVPLENQTTVRVRKDLRDKLKKIAVVSEITVFDLVNELIGEHIRRFESALGTSVDEMGRVPRDY